VRIELRGLELHGRHGVLEREQAEGQRFLFDVELEVGEEAAVSDRIEDAVDYRDVAAAVRDVSDGRRYHLLEALAAAVADALLERFPVSSARVRVAKPDVVLDPPVRESAAVSVVRERA
jgi:7,8-dihydroneopterin aldolase/epimerase/oxygenase